MPNLAKAWGSSLLLLALPLAAPASAQTIVALPDQTSTIRLSNRDINHVICAGGEIEDVKFSAEKAIAVERAGSDAWIKFLVREIDDAGAMTRTYVTVPSEFFITCNGAAASASCWTYSTRSRQRPISGHHHTKIGMSAFRRLLLRPQSRRSALRCVRFWAASVSPRPRSKPLSP